MNDRRRGGKQVFVKRMKSTGEMTEPRGIAALMECRLERKPSTLMAIETANPFNESVMETKYWLFSEKIFVPDAIKGLGEIERDYSTLTIGL